MTDNCTDDTCSIDAAPPSSVSAFEPGPGKHVLYFGDPMCSWCWGFTPVLQGIQAAVQGRAELHMVMGGLRPGTADTWDQEMRDYIRHHWQQVEEKTGQPFDDARFDDENFIYDTEPGCRALVVARNMDLAKAPAMYEALQRGFYAEGLDITKPEVLADIAQTQGLERAEFLANFSLNKAREQVVEDFNRSRAFGVTGFPSVLCSDDGQYAFLTLGYRPLSAVAPLLEEWLNA